MKKCPQGHENPDDANFCRICGIRFNDKPEIAYFHHNADYKIGDIVDLTWKVANADIVTLNGRKVSDNETTRFVIDGNTTFRLEALKGKHRIEKVIMIHPQHNPLSSDKAPDKVMYSNILHNKIMILLALMALILLFTIYCFGESIQYHFNFSYRGWQNANSFIKIIGWTMTVLCIAYWSWRFYKNHKKV